MVAAQAVPAKKSTDAAPSRKKRRKTPSTGASEDCFSCIRRAAACDRRRPYCTQCLELGKECSGYRTVLTWGVGVASRGKLRGRTLPVTNSSDKPKASVSSPPKRSSKSASPKPDGQQPQSFRASAPDAQTQRADRTSVKKDQGASAKETRPAVENVSEFSPPTALPLHSVNWDGKGIQSGERGSTSSNATSEQRPIPPKSTDRFHRIHASPALNHDDPTTWASPASTVSYGAISDGSYDPPSSYPQTPDHLSQYEPLILEQRESLHAGGNIHVSNARSPNEFNMSLDGHATGQWDMRSMNTAKSRSPSSYASELESSPAAHGDFSHFGRIQFVSDTNPSIQDDYLDEEWEGLELVQSSSAKQPHDWFAIAPRATFDTPFLQLPPRLQYLLDFYDKAICSVLVAFDGPENPYRANVLPLAMQNPALQNAIGALVTNNMRMREVNETRRRLKNDPAWANDQVQRDLRKSTGMPSMEEQHYKAMSIDLLNKQLAVPGSEQDDSVLATLLILCLFHVCDSGFSKFKMQLAGVQKLLRLRGQALPSNFVHWIEMFFSWFDVMTAAVNDREVQVHNPAFTDLSMDLGALEQFSGCDGKLFKLIARLSRLNLLSQGRPVRDETTDALRSEYAGSNLGNDPTYEFGAELLQGGFGNTRSTQKPSGSPLVECNGIKPPDDRIQFWREWSDIRRRLKEWKMSPQYHPIEGFHDMPTSHQDMTHISESFRYSALLYTERLAYPQNQASSPNFQELVEQSMAHINAIGDNSVVLKFMLWPLFMTGTECVDQRHRNTIRHICEEISIESGFYNNLNGLEVLERVWREGQHDGDNRHDSRPRQAFMWRKAMDRVDGEYILI